MGCAAPPLNRGRQAGAYLSGTAAGEPAKARPVSPADSFVGVSSAAAVAEQLPEHGRLARVPHGGGGYRHLEAAISTVVPTTVGLITS